ncbi:MAG: hypothetical protein AAGD38_24590, partial [Acidobacteriota bacterium]
MLIFGCRTEPSPSEVIETSSADTPVVALETTPPGDEPSNVDPTLVATRLTAKMWWNQASVIEGLTLDATQRARIDLVFQRYVQARRARRTAPPPDDASFYA